MKISDVFPHLRAEKLQGGKGTRTDSTSTDNAVRADELKDRIDLSSSSKEVLKIQELLKDTPAVRQEKVQMLKEKIERNEYRVEARQVADKMLASLVSDILPDGK